MAHESGSELGRADRITSRRRWEQLVDDRSHVYATWEWGSVCEAFGHDRYYLGIEEDGVLVAGLPLMYVGSRLFGRELVSMPYAPYGSVLLPDGADEREGYRDALLDAVRSLSDSLAVARTSLRGIELDPDREEFKSTSRFVTFERDLTDGEDGAWDDVSSRFRRSVRKARKENVRVERRFDDSSLAAFYDMYLDNMRYHGTPPYSRQFFRNANEYLGRRDAFEMYLAYDEEDRPINGITAFFSGDRAIYWIGVSDHEYRDLDGGSLLLWEAIVDSCERGYPVFDLGRTRDGTGVYDYKKSIGDPIELTDAHYAPDGDVVLVDPEAETYDPYKRVWRKLPVRVTEYLGPPLRKRSSL